MNNGFRVDKHRPAESRYNPPYARARRQKLFRKTLSHRVLSKRTIRIQRATLRVILCRFMVGVVDRPRSCASLLLCIFLFRFVCGTNVRATRISRREDEASAKERKRDRERESRFCRDGNRGEIDEKGRAHNSAGRPLAPGSSPGPRLADGFFCNGEVYIGTLVLNPRAN